MNGGSGRSAGSGRRSCPRSRSAPRGCGRSSAIRQRGRASRCALRRPVQDAGSYDGADLQRLERPARAGCGGAGRPAPRAVPVAPPARLRRSAGSATPRSASTQRCGYRFYAERVLRLPTLEPGAAGGLGAGRARPGARRRTGADRDRARDPRPRAAREARLPPAGAAGAEAIVTRRGVDRAGAESGRGRRARRAGRALRRQRALRPARPRERVAPRGAVHVPARPERAAC